VILQIAPGRERYHSHDDLIPPLDEELALLRLLGAEVWAITLNEDDMDQERGEEIRAALQEEHGLPVVRPLRGGTEELARIVTDRIRKGETP
jgi:uncharacterized NAD-dependent epimerase/dehydratase family protein